jgi:hypothetical protein
MLTTFISPAYASIRNSVLPRCRAVLTIRANIGRANIGYTSTGELNA